MKNLKSKLYGFTLGLLLVVSVLSVTFGVMMHSTNVQNTYQNLLRTELTDTVQKIRYGVSFGKKISSYYGVETLLQDTVQDSEYIESLYVLSGGSVLYRTGDAAPPASALGLAAGAYTTDEHRFCAAFALTDDSLLLAQMGTAQIESRQQAFLLRLISVSVVGFLLLVALITLLWWRWGGRGAVVMVVAWVVLLGSYVGVMCWTEYLSSQEMLVQSVEKSVMADIDRLGGEGIPYGELVDVNGYLNLYLENIPELEALQMTDGHLTYQ